MYNVYIATITITGIIVGELLYLRYLRESLRRNTSKEEGGIEKKVFDSMVLDVGSMKSEISKLNMAIGLKGQVKK